jgi:hypothetical protein
MFIERGKSRKYIIEQLSAIKKNGERAPIWSNFYFHNFIDEAPIVIRDKKSIVFSLADRDLYRLYFFSRDLNELDKMILGIDFKPLVADYITAGSRQGIEDLFHRSGFETYAKMLHMTNNDQYPSEKDGAIKFADVSDEAEIAQRLLEWLDKYTGHFPDRSELRSLITDKQVLVEKTGDRIVGLYIYKIQGQTGNLDQWAFSKDPGEYDPDLALRLNTNALYLLREKGAKKTFLWINERNTRIIKIHALNGFLHDGLSDYIYLKAN